MPKLRWRERSSPHELCWFSRRCWRDSWRRDGHASPGRRLLEIQGSLSVGVRYGPWFILSTVKETNTYADFDSRESTGTRTSVLIASLSEFRKKICDINSKASRKSNEISSSLCSFFNFLRKAVVLLDRYIFLSIVRQSLIKYT